MTFEQVAILAGWVLLLLLSLLVLRVLGWMHAYQVLLGDVTGQERAEPIALGSAAPQFRARYLDGTPAGHEDIAGVQALLLFVSPACGTCRREMRGLVRLGHVADQRAGLRVILVSDQQAPATQEWVNDLRAADGVTVDLQVIVAPPRTSELIPRYNPPGVMPAYCLVGADGTVAARGLLGTGEWLALRARWEGPPVIRRTLAGRRGTG